MPVSTYEVPAGTEHGWRRAGVRRGASEDEGFAAPTCNPGRYGRYGKEIEGAGRVRQRRAVRGGGRRAGRVRAGRRERGGGPVDAARGGPRRDRAGAVPGHA